MTETHAERYHNAHKGLDNILRLVRRIKESKKPVTASQARVLSFWAEGIRNFVEQVERERRVEE